MKTLVLSLKGDENTQGGIEAKQKVIGGTKRRAQANKRESVYIYIDDYDDKGFG